MAIINVTSAADNGAGSLRSAIASAQAGDTIKFASTLANQVITLTSGQINIKNNLTIDGADAANLQISGNNTGRVFEVERNINATVRNLNITNGVTDGRGGGINVVDYGSITVENCQFSNNRGGEGGAIHIGYGGNGTVTNSTFDSNDGTLTNSGFSSGAIATYGSGNLIVKDSQFTNNKGVNGGAIYSLLGGLTIENSVFLNNSSEGDIGGGAVFTDGANPVGPGSTVGGVIAIRGSRFEGNKTKGEGGALFLYGYGPDEILLENSTVVNNTANWGNQGNARGGGLRANSNLTIRNVTFANNTSDQQGGALWLDDGSPKNIINSTFSGNKVINDAGGAMFVNTDTSTPVNIVNSTIVDNSAGRASGAVWIGDPNASVILTNSIVANNTAGDPSQQQVGYQLKDGGGNIEFPAPQQGSRVVSNSRIVDPLLGPLQTIDGYLVHPLLAGSPAINTGKTGNGIPIVDERGILRDTNPDVGAFEIASQPNTNSANTNISDPTILSGTPSNDQPQDTQTNDIVQGTSSNDQPQDTQTNDIVQGNSSNEQPQDTQTNDIVQGTSTNEQPQDTQTNDIVQGTSTNDQPQDTQTNDIVQGTSTNEQPQDTQTNDIVQGTSTNDQPQDTQTNDIVQGTSTNDQPQDTQTNDIVQETSSNDQPQDTQTNDIFQGTSSNDQPQDTQTNDIFQGTSSNDQPQDTQTNDIFQGTSTNDQPQRGESKDVLIGGNISDVLRGIAAGKERFVYQNLLDKGDSILHSEAGKNLGDLRKIIEGRNFSNSNFFKNYLNKEQLGSDTFVNTDPNADLNSNQFHKFLRLNNFTSSDLTASNFIKQQNR